MQRALDEVHDKAISAMVLKLFRQHGNDLTITGLRDAFKGGRIEELGVVAATLDAPAFSSEELAAFAGRIAAARWVDDAYARAPVKKTYRQRVLEQSERELTRRDQSEQLEQAERTGAMPQR